nr:hypothetical protein [Propionicimonas sp.]
MPAARTTRPTSVVVAVSGTVLVGLALVGLAIGSLASGHGQFSGGVGLFLAVYGLGLCAAAWGLWRLSLFGRGPVVALSLLNVVAGFTFTASAPWVWAFVVVSAVTVVAAALPSTSRALHLRSKP